MVERKRIGFRFSYNENWIAGTYYILNIIHALNTLKEEQQPHVVIVTESFENFELVRKETNYAHLEFFKYPFPIPRYNLLQRIINKAGRTIIKKNVIVKKPKQPDIQLLYPNQVHDIKTKKLKFISWIPDFQEDYLPEYFSEKEINERKHFQKTIAAQGDMVVLSSEDARNDFQRLYPEAVANTFVLPFAVTHPDYSDQNISEILTKYDLPKHYFFVPNQFWAHKNHIIVLKALRILKERNIELVIAMTGKENDYRNLDNYKNLTTYVEKHGLEKCVRFLGFISREEQLCLMKNTIAVVHPSLFEGWSTVVEDAKLLNTFLILSDLNVHKEQIQENAHFFDPYDQNALADILESYSEKTPQIIEIEYKDNVFQFGKKFMNFVDKVT